MLRSRGTPLYSEINTLDISRLLILGLYVKHTGNDKGPVRNAKEPKLGKTLPKLLDRSLQLIFAHHCDMQNFSQVSILVMIGPWSTILCSAELLILSRSRFMAAGIIIFGCRQLRAMPRLQRVKVSETDYLCAYSSWWLGVDSPAVTGVFRTPGPSIHGVHANGGLFYQTLPRSSIKYLINS